MNRKPWISFVLLGIFCLSMVCEFSNFDLSNQNNQTTVLSEDPSQIMNDKSNGNEEIIEGNPSIPQSQSASSWWNEAFDRRIELTVTEPNIYARTNEPVKKFVEFENETCFINSTRIIYFDGVSQTEIISQVFNLTMWLNGTESDPKSYIKSCTLAFSITIAKNSVNIYYIYYSSTQQTSPSYSGLTVSFDDTRAKVDTGLIYSEFAEKSTFDILKFSDRQATLDPNYHTSSSMAPSPYITSGSKSEFTTLSGSYYIRNWLLVGAFYSGTTWANFPTNQNATASHIDVSKFYTSESYATPMTPALTGSDATRKWQYYSSSTDSIILNGLFNYNDYAVAYALAYVYFPTTISSVTLFAGSDDGIKIFWDGVPYWTSASDHVLRGLTLDQTKKSLGQVNAGWHKLILCIEENTGDWSFSARFSSNPSTFTAIPGLITSVSPQPLIESIDLVENGPVFAEFQVQWQDFADMRTTEYITFYRQFSLYQSIRMFQWNSGRSLAAGNSSWSVANTYYNTATNTGVDTFVKDGTTGALSSDKFNSQQYIAGWDSDFSNYYATFGMIITDFKKGPGILSFTHVNSTANFNNDQIQIVPGYQSDLNVTKPLSAFDNSLNVSYWEILEKNQANNPSNIVARMNGLYNSLKNPVSCSNGSVEILFFNLDVTLIDVDGQAATGVNITLFNTTIGWSGVDYSPNLAIPGSQQTNNEGKTTFSRLKSANYTCLVSYQAYGQSAKNITWFNVSLDTTKSVSVSNINLTRMTFSFSNLKKIEPIIGANVSLYWNETNGPGKYVGSLITDSNGQAEFYWFNRSESEGNYSIKAFFYGSYKKINATVIPLNQLSDTINFTFASATEPIPITMNLETFSSSLIDVSTTEQTTKMWGEILSANFSFRYTYGDVGSQEEGPIQDATIRFTIYSYDTRSVIYEETLGNVQYEQGFYHWEINSSDPKYGLNSPKSYVLNVYADKPGYAPSSTPLPLVINDISTLMTVDQASFNVYWLENFTFSLYYRQFDSLAIENATVEYVVPQLPSVTGFLSPDLIKGAGWYTGTLNSTEFIYSGAYSLTLSAVKQHYVQKSQTLNVLINKIRTLLNNKIFVPLPVTMNVTTSRNFTFNYTDSAGVGIPNAVVKYYELESDDYKINGTLIDEGNGLYTLAINPELLPIGKYSVVIAIGQTNYVERSAVLSLIIISKPIQIDFTGESLTQVISQPQGQNITISFTLTDLVAGSPLAEEGTVVQITYETPTGEMKTEAMTSIGNGRYEFVIYTKDYQALVTPISFFATIEITRANYTVVSKQVSITITPPVIFGIPQMFVYVGLGVGLFAMVVYGSVQSVKYARIPPSVKRIMETRKLIKKRKDFSRNPVATLRDGSYKKRLDEYWQAIGLEYKLETPSGNAMTTGDQKNGVL